MAKQDDMKDLIPFDYLKFRDSARKIAMRRGASEPCWQDVWLAFAQDSKGGDLLREMGVDTADLQSDLAFTQLYGRPLKAGEQPTATPAEQRAERSALLSELLTDLDAYLLVQQQAASGAPHTLRDLREDFAGFIHYVGQLDQSDKTEKKLHLLNTLAVAFINERGYRHAPHHYDDRVSAVLGLKQFIEARQVVLQEAHSPLKEIEAMLDGTGHIDQAKAVHMKPSELLEILQETSDPYYHYLLARNGMVVDEQYQPPYRMLSRPMARLGLQAYQLAYDERDTTISPLHFARLLLDSPAIQTGVRELIKHEVIAARPADMDAAQRAKPGLSPSENEQIAERVAATLQAIRERTQPHPSGAERFRKQISVSPVMARLLQTMSQKQVSAQDLPDTVTLFGDLLAQAEVADLLKLAGIQPATIAKWDAIQQAHYAEQKALRGKDKDSVRNDSPSRFKVSDEELEQLFASYGRDLTKAAAAGKLSPVIGRDEEMDQIQEILLRKGKRNAILLGEPGVGKTALFEGFAQQVINGNVPQKLLGARVVEIDLQSMNAGAMFRGQFEERLKGVVDGVAERNASGKFPPIILCIDELHAAMQAGTASGTPGASEMMKPALTRGDLLTIGSTTEREYRQTIAKDGALSRRFEPVIVREPKREHTLTILKGMVSHYQAHHRIEIPEALLDELTRLCGRYIQGYSPDKDLSILDMACAKAAKLGATALARQHILESVAQKGRLPIDFLSRDDGEKALTLPATLRGHVFGQEQATSKVADAVIKAKAGLQDPNKPIASFLFQGPTGVGKTETAKALAIHEFGSEEALVRIDMGEYGEAHTISRLLGAPPGYVGHDEEGQLTAAISRRPHSVILLDEVEKAHPKVFDALLALLDDGRMTDGQGRTVDFRNTIIIMTTNHKEPKKLFRPEMFNRIDAVIPFNPLPREIVYQLIDRQLEKLEARMQEQFGCALVLSDHAKQQLAERGYQPEYGARPLNRAVDQYVVSPLAPWLLRHQAEVRGKAIRINDIDAFEPVVGESKAAVTDAPDATVQAVEPQGTTKPKGRVK